MGDITKRLLFQAQHNNAVKLSLIKTILQFALCGVEGIVRCAEKSKLLFPAPHKQQFPPSTPWSDETVINKSA